MPTLRQLAYVAALARHGHFGRAADACNVTQSTLSAGIKEAEALLGPIFERDRRFVRPTELGARIIDQAVRVLREAETLGDVVRSAEAPLSGDLHLGVIPTIAPFLLPAVLPELRRRWPSLRLFLREEPSQAACEELANGKLDCVVLALPFPMEGVTIEELFDDPLRVAFPPGSKGLPSEVAPGMIDETRLLLLEDGHCLKEHVLAACDQAGMRARTHMLATSLHTLVQMVANGIGQTLVPEMAIRAGLLDRTGIEIRSLEGGSAARRIALIWRRSSPRSVDFKLLAASLTEIWVKDQEPQSI